MRHIVKSLGLAFWLTLFVSAAQASYLGNGPFNIGLWNGASLGSPSNYGTSPGAVSVIGVNAFVTNTLSAALNTTPTIANGNGVVPTQGGAVLSATNGIYSNVLQGNAALSATNGIFANLLQGNAVLSTSNPIFMTGTGTAGSAATNPITVQGIASMTPLLANPGTAANWGIGAIGSSVVSNGYYNSINVGGTTRGWTGVNPTGTTYAGQIDLTSVGGTLVALGSTTASASIPVVIASNQTAADPCMYQAKSNVTVSQTASGTLITGTSGKKNYLCSLTIIASAAVNVSLVEYSGTCTGGTAFALLGSTTAANGLPLAANGGLAYGTGGNTVVSGAGDTNSGYNVCLLQNGSGTVVAQATYISQ